MVVNIAFALLNIVKLGEDDIKAKRTKRASVVFSEIKEKLQGQAQ
jgi:hypothetical protein